MAGIKVGEKKCNKPFLYEGKWLCGYAHPGEPECKDYDSTSELVHIKSKGGEKTMHRYCKQKNEEHAKAAASATA